jgi:hypothetical protein
VGHEDLVRCVRFNSEYVISGSYDNSIRIWDFKTGKELHKLQKHTNRVFRLQFDDVKIVSSSQDDHIIIWDFMSDIAKRRKATLTLEPQPAGRPRPYHDLQGRELGAFTFETDAKPIEERAFRPSAS